MQHVALVGLASAGGVREDAELQSLCDGGRLDKALDVLLRMNQQGGLLTNTYKRLLEACAEKKALVHARRLHAHLAQRGLESTWPLGQSLVVTLAKCGGLEDAQKLLEMLPITSVSSWAAIISGCTNSRRGREALRIYRCMQVKGLEPNKAIFVSLVRACGTLADLDEGKRIHAEALKYGYGTDLFLGTCVVDMYAKCRSIADAHIAFQNLSQRDVVSWNVMIAAYAQEGQTGNALQLYREMREADMTANERTFVTMFRVCGILADKEDAVMSEGQSIKAGSLQKGKVLHFDAWRLGYGSDVYVGNTLISMYAKCGGIADAWRAFDELLQRDEISWTAMLSACTQQGEAEEALQLYEQMLEDGVSPDDRTIVIMLQACGMLAVKEGGEVVEGCCTDHACLQLGKTLHAEGQRRGHGCDAFVGSTLISMYGKCGSIIDAHSVFEACQDDFVSWNAMLTVCVEQGEAENTLQMYEQMWMSGVSPRDRTFVNAFLAIGMLAESEEDVLANGHPVKSKALERGKAVHAMAWGRGLRSDVFIGSTLIVMYAKCKSMRDAQLVFDELPQHDAATWSAMLAANVEHSRAEQGLQLYRQMVESGICPRCRTFVSVVQACAILAEKEEDFVLDCHVVKVKALDHGKSIHAETMRACRQANLLINNGLISMYGKCGSILDARTVFDGLVSRDVVSWTAMLAAYAQQGQAEEALHLYREMQRECISPNEITFVCVLHACGQSGRLDVCKEIHNMARNSMTSLLANALIHAYSRCASMVDAETVFDATPEPDVVTWTALIAGYARQGNWAAGLQLYQEMQLAGVTPDAVTFLCLIAACSHAGLVDRGIDYFESMSKDYGITPEIGHYAGMVDLLGRAGCFALVEELLLRMPMQPDLPLWICLIGACRKHGEVSLGKWAFDRAVGLEPQHSAAYLLMANIYADAGLPEHALEVKELREKESAWKKPGQTWLHYLEEVHTFVVRDCRHPQQARLYEFLRLVGLELEKLANVQPG